MNSNHDSLNEEQIYTIRGTAKMLNAGSAKYGGDWHSIPHVRHHMEQFYIVVGMGKFSISLLVMLTELYLPRYPEKRFS